MNGVFFFQEALRRVYANVLSRTIITARIYIYIYVCVLVLVVKPVEYIKVSHTEVIHLGVVILLE